MASFAFLVSIHPKDRRGGYFYIDRFLQSPYDYPRAIRARPGGGCGENASRRCPKGLMAFWFETSTTFTDRYFDVSSSVTDGIPLVTVTSNPDVLGLLYLGGIKLFGGFGTGPLL